eukprot:Phypoly_transcript_13615.p1 GENE.Phypoly_transcript_13615~~Phypoly_transcript_13615.p1  ORF type:complete len:221 (+),score=30.46 Phypoly_transcript_13615:232-894(+)
MHDSEDAQSFLAELLVRKANLTVLTAVDYIRRSPLCIAMENKNMRALAAITSLRGNEVLEAPPWVSYQHIKTSTVRTKLQIQIIMEIDEKQYHFCRAKTARRLYMKMWRYGPYRFLQFWWKGAVIFPGEQSLYDLGLRDKDKVYANQQKVMSPWIVVGYFLPAPPPFFDWNPRIHHFFPKIVRESVKSFLLVEKRLNGNFDSPLKHKIIKYICFLWHKNR